MQNLLNLLRLWFLYKWRFIQLTSNVLVTIGDRNFFNSKCSELNINALNGKMETKQNNSRLEWIHSQSVFTGETWNAYTNIGRTNMNNCRGRLRKAACFRWQRMTSISPPLLSSSILWWLMRQREIDEGVSWSSYPFHFYKKNIQLVEEV